VLSANIRNLDIWNKCDLVPIYKLFKVDSYTFVLSLLDDAYGTARVPFFSILRISIIIGPMQLHCLVNPSVKMEYFNLQGRAHFQTSIS
jgi:hypothetical protein